MPALISIAQPTDVHVYAPMLLPCWSHRCNGVNAIRSSTESSPPSWHNATIYWLGRE